jgi:hypothetical protein
MRVGLLPGTDGARPVGLRRCCFWAAHVPAVVLAEPWRLGPF